jgi:hypothetical protein
LVFNNFVTYILPYKTSICNHLLLNRTGAETLTFPKNGWIALALLLLLLLFRLTDQLLAAQIAAQPGRLTGRRHGHVSLAGAIIRVAAGSAPSPLAAATLHVAAAIPAAAATAVAGLG